MAASTWLGIRVSDVQAEPLATLMPRRSSSSHDGLPGHALADERHDVRQPVDGVADHLDPRRQRGQPAPDELGQVEQPVRLGLDVRGEVLQRRGRRRRAGGVREAVHPATVRVLVRGPAHGGPDREDADPGGTAPVTGGGGQDVPVDRRGTAPDDLDRVHEQGHTDRPRRCRHLGERLPRAHLPIGRLDAQDVSRRVERPSEGVEVDPARAVHGNALHRGRPAIGRARHGEALDGTDDRAAGPATCHQRLDGDGRGGGARGRQEHLVRAHSEAGGDAGAGGVEHHPGPATGVVQAGRIAPGLLRGGQPRLPGDGQQRLPGDRVEVSRRGPRGRVGERRGRGLGFHGIHASRRLGEPRFCLVGAPTFGAQGALVCRRPPT